MVRTTKTSISLADPEGGRNLRLRGAIYEQSFENGDGFQAEIERAGERYRQLLKQEFDRLGTCVSRCRA
ncbi:MbeA [Salmonella enterica subsp. arizonae]|uniref:MbeA n=1 Tax=Salmonella enterica subsp. arizonae TaxID=59203 RepID=A0A379TMU3_SALER|nr:MbeA [Salmonella enterica subsp. arizonae]